MRRWLLISSLAISVGLVGCGPSGGNGSDEGGNDEGGNDEGGSDQVDAGDDGGDDQSTRPDARPRVDAAAPATLTGKVWAPNLTSDIPIFGALVYATTVKPPPIPQEVFCEECVDAPGNATFSSHDGSFTLSIDPGTYWLVIQKGQFRSERQITVEPGQALALTAAETTLPSVHDPDNGSWVPRVAVVLGSDDRIENVLGKIGFGTMQNNRVTSTGREMVVYQNLDGDSVSIPDSEITGTGNALLGDLAALKRFHIVFFACSTADLNMTPQVRRNIREYVNAGGKIYVTDWAGEVMDQAFPPQVTFHGYNDRRGTADTTGTYDPIALTDAIDQAGTANGTSSPFQTTDSRPVDADLKTWLGLQSAPTPASATARPINVDAGFLIDHHYNRINALTPVQVGVDEQGAPIINTPKVWLEGSARGGTAGQKYPYSVTFEPTGCGRVLYSTYETSGAAHASLYPQERVLLYLIMEIGVCTAVVPPVD
jgi:hypothetical protein